MIEEEYIVSVKGKNVRLFAADKIEIKPQSLESLLRHAFRAGQKSVKQEKKGPRRGSPVDDLFSKAFEGMK